MNISNLDVLVAQAQSGDRRAANHLAHHLLSKFRPAIAAAARRIGDQESLSAAGLAVTEAIRKVRPGDSIEALFFLRFHSHSLTEARSYLRRVIRETDASQIAVQSSDNLESEYAISARLSNADLSAREKEIVLARLHGQTLQEIAKALRVSTAAVGYTLSRIFKKLETANELA